MSGKKMNNVHVYSGEWRFIILDCPLFAFYTEHDLLYFIAVTSNKK